MKQKRAQHEKVQAELQNLLGFIKAGNFSKLVSEAIVDAEGRSDKLQTEMKAMKFQTKNAFKAPPKEWIEHRLDKFKETLGINTKASALALKDLLGTIEMEAVPGECVVENGNLIQNKPYYLAHSNIDTLALFDQPKGTNWSLLRTREGPIRTAALLPCQIKISFNDNVPVYQELSRKILQLKALGMTNQEIADKLKITRKSVGKAVSYDGSTLC